MLARFRSRDVVISAKDSLLGCIASGTAADVLTEFARQVEPVLGADARWCVGLGRPPCWTRGCRALL